MADNNIRDRLRMFEQAGQQQQQQPKPAPKKQGGAVKKMAAALPINLPQLGGGVAQPKPATKMNVVHQEKEKEKEKEEVPVKKGGGRALPKPGAAEKPGGAVQPAADKQNEEIIDKYRDDVQELIDEGKKTHAKVISLLDANIHPQMTQEEYVDYKTFLTMDQLSYTDRLDSIAARLEKRDLSVADLKGLFDDAESACQGLENIYKNVCAEHGLSSIEQLQDEFKDAKSNILGRISRDPVFAKRDKEWFTSYVESYVSDRVESILADYKTALAENRFEKAGEAKKAFSDWIVVKSLGWNQSPQERKNVLRQLYEDALPDYNRYVNAYKEAKDIGGSDNYAQGLLEARHFCSDTVVKHVLRKDLSLLEVNYGQGFVNMSSLQVQLGNWFDNPMPSHYVEFSKKVKENAAKIGALENKRREFEQKVISKCCELVRGAVGEIEDDSKRITLLTNRIIAGVNAYPSPVSNAILTYVNDPRIGQDVAASLVGANNDRLSLNNNESFQSAIDKLTRCLGRVQQSRAAVRRLEFIAKAFVPACNGAQQLINKLQGMHAAFGNLSNPGVHDAEFLRGKLVNLYSTGSISIAEFKQASILLAMQAVANGGLVSRHHAFNANQNAISHLILNVVDMFTTSQKTEGITQAAVAKRREFLSLRNDLRDLLQLTLVSAPDQFEKTAPSHIEECREYEAAGEAIPLHLVYPHTEERLRALSFEVIDKDYSGLEKLTEVSLKKELLFKNIGVWKLDPMPELPVGMKDDQVLNAFREMLNKHVSTKWTKEDKDLFRAYGWNVNDLGGALRDMYVQPHYKDGAFDRKRVMKALHWITTNCKDTKEDVDFVLALATQAVTHSDACSARARRGLMAIESAIIKRINKVGQKDAKKYSTAGTHLAIASYLLDDKGMLITAARELNTRSNKVIGGVEVETELYMMVCFNRLLNLGLTAKSMSFVGAAAHPPVAEAIHLLFDNLDLAHMNHELKEAIFGKDIGAVEKAQDEFIAKIRKDPDYDSEADGITDDEAERREMLVFKMMNALKDYFSFQKLMDGGFISKGCFSLGDQS